MIVSTDSPRYAEIAREHGAEVPFQRPLGLAEDGSTDIEVFQHALDWLERHEHYQPEICVHLRPTYPLRRAEDIDEAVTLLRADASLDSVRTVAPAPFSPFKMWFMGEDGLLTPCVRSTIPEPYNRPRQSLPPAYAQTASIDVVRARVIRAGSMTGARIRGLLMRDNHDIDSLPEFRAAELRTPGGLTGRRFVFDVDGVIASLVPDGDYGQATPLQTNIETVNHLYDLGNRIILFTARGSLSGIDWEALTTGQLQAWGVKYHELRFGKPAADYYIDDRAVSVRDLGPLLGARPAPTDQRHD